MTKFITDNSNLIISLLTISIQIAALVGLVWQIRKTFESERKASTKQFLNEAQLESVKKILINVDKAYALIIESGVTINREIDRLGEQNKVKTNDRKIIREDNGAEIVPFYDKKIDHINRHDFFRLIHEAELLLKSIDIYIHFVPELKEQLETIKIAMSEYRYISRSILAVSYPTETAHRDSIEKQVSLQNEISSLKDNLITLHSEIIKELYKTIKDERNLKTKDIIEKNKSKATLFLENEELNKWVIIRRISLLYLLVVFFLYLLIAIIKFYNTPDIKIFQDPGLSLMILLIIIMFIATVFSAFRTLKNKKETEKIASFFNNIVLPFTVLGTILIGIDDLESIASMKEFVTSGEPIKAFNDLFKATYLIIAPLVCSIFYNVTIWWKEFPEIKEKI